MAVGILTITDDTAFRVIAKSITQFKRGIHRGLMAVAPEIVKEIQRGILEPPKTGRLYFHGGNLHQASAPGEYPAELTGELRMGVKSVVDGCKQLTVGDEAPYGGDLEYGKGNLKPRPHLITGALSKAREVGQAIGQHIVASLGPT